MEKIKVISFDLDGTLIDDGFVNAIWFEGIPQQYAFKKGVPFEYAKTAVTKEYEKIGKNRIEWYNLSYWINKFDLNVTPKELFKKFKQKIRVYPEVPQTLESLKKRCVKLVIVTNAFNYFAEIELRTTGIESYFKRVFSVTSDFGAVKKTERIYQKICDVLKIRPQEMIHLGDDWNFDFNVPRKLGIKAFHVNRAGKHDDKWVITGLSSLDQKIGKYLTGSLTAKGMDKTVK